MQPKNPFLNAVLSTLARKFKLIIDFSDSCKQIYVTKALRLIHTLSDLAFSQWVTNDLKTAMV
jgi:hypothetical protein